MDYQHTDSQAHQPIWPNYTWLAQAMGGQHHINALSIVPQSSASAHEFHRPVVLGPALYLDEMYFCPGATGDPSIQFVTLLVLRHDTKPDTVLEPNMTALINRMASIVKISLSQCHIHL